MPQLWLTYHEIAEELGCAPMAARQAVIARAWTRKHSSDGQTRVLLPADMMQAYFMSKALSPPAVERSAPPDVQLWTVLSRAASGVAR